MRIQEMRSGSAHLRKRMTEDRFEPQELADASVDPEPASPAEQLCELEMPIWSLISFDRVEAGGLTYDQAARILRELDAAGLSGLCIITDEAARKASHR